MHTLVLSTGSNLGDRKKNLDSALELLVERIGPVKRASAVYESPSWGYKSNNSFYNQCLVLATDLPPDDCLGLMLGIEQRLGRHRKGNIYSDRTIDIDMLFFDDRVMESPVLDIPHKQLAERRFVLLPLAEIIPDFVHPVSGKTIRELLDECPDKSELLKVF